MSTRLRKSPSTFLNSVAARPVVRPPTVLIVDDHEDTRVLLRYVMEQKGRLVVEATDGNQAVDIAGKVRPDLILMDTGLPDIDGVVATQHIRQLPELRDVPIVFVSGHVQPHVRAAALALGGTQYLTKPVSLEELELVITRCLFRGVRRH